jgi:hypothetical protein
MLEVVERHGCTLASNLHTVSFSNLPGLKHLPFIGQIKWLQVKQCTSYGLQQVFNISQRYCGELVATCRSIGWFTVAQLGSNLTIDFNPNLPPKLRSSILSPPLPHISVSQAGPEVRPEVGPKLITVNHPNEYCE